MKDESQKKKSKLTQPDPQMIATVTAAVVQALQATGSAQENSEVSIENKQEPKSAVANGYDAGHVPEWLLSGTNN